MDLPKDFKELCYSLDKKFNFKNILVINTPITGEFLDTIFLEERTVRIKYDPKNYIEFVEKIGMLNKKFDLICVDPNHEYKDSLKTLKLLILLLSDNGILISHDCNPPNFISTSEIFKGGEWCGSTYATFVEISYNNPELYYAVINKDYGLGIISKKEIDYVKKKRDSKKQKIFLDIFYEKNYEEAFYYFKDNCYNIINLID